MSKVTKLHRNSVDELIEQVNDIDAIECVVVIRKRDRNVMMMISENTHTDTLALGGLLINEAARSALCDDVED